MSESRAQAGTDLGPGELETDRVVVRSLAASDAEAVARIDELHSGRPRRDFFRRKIARALDDPGVRLSLAAELDGRLAGFLVASVDYGQFGVLEPVAVLDAVGVHPDLRGRHVGRALLRQLALNLRALGIERVRTEVDWRQQDLLGFFARAGFRPAPRLVLEATAADLDVAPGA